MPDGFAAESAIAVFTVSALSPTFLFAGFRAGIIESAAAPVVSPRNSRREIGRDSLDPNIGSFIKAPERGQP